jgi:hypothetical protein
MNKIKVSNISFYLTKDFPSYFKIRWDNSIKRKKIVKVLVPKSRKQYSRNGSHGNTLPEVNCNRYLPSKFAPKIRHVSELTEIVLVFKIRPAFPTSVKQENCSRAARGVELKKHGNVSIIKMWSFLKHYDGAQPGKL